MKFNRISLIALALAAPLAFAQTSTPMQAQPQTDNATTPPPAVIVLPERVIETTVDLSTGGPQSGQSAADARTEAINSLGEVKAECRRETRGAALSDCLRRAQDEYNAVMARTAGRHR